MEVPFEPPPKKDEDDAAEDSDELFNRIESDEEGDGTAEAAERLAERKRQDNQLARAIDLLKGIQVYQSRGLNPFERRARLFRR